MQMEQQHIHDLDVLFKDSHIVLLTIPHMPYCNISLDLTLTILIYHTSRYAASPQTPPELA